MVLSLCTHESNIKIFYIFPTHCVYVFCINLRTNVDFFPFNMKWFDSIMKLEFDTTQFDTTQFDTTQFDTTQFDTTQFEMNR